MKTRSSEKKEQAKRDDRLEGITKHAGTILQSETKNGKPIWKAGRSIIPRGVVRNGISKRWPQRLPVRAPASKGLRNTGNSCYRSGLLQCLLHMPKVYHYLGNIHKQCDEPPERCLVCAVQALFQDYWNGKYPTPEAHTRGPVKAVKNVTKALKHSIPVDDRLYSEVQDDQQADPIDFAQILLDQLRLKHDCAGISFDNLVSGVLEARWTCADCGESHVSQPDAELLGDGFTYGINTQIYEPETKLSLVEYLRHKFGNLKWALACTSEQCADEPGKPRAIQCVYTQTPEILMIRLVRYCQIIKKGKVIQQVIRDRVAIEEFLDLGEYTASGDNAIYRLEGVVAHNLPKGKGDAGGHYIAAVRENNGKTFCTINDNDRIQREWRGAVANLFYPRSYKTDYSPVMLLYSKL